MTSYVVSELCNVLEHGRFFRLQYVHCQGTRQLALLQVPGTHGLNRSHYRGRLDASHDARSLIKTEALFFHAACICALQYTRSVSFVAPLAS